MKIMVLADDEQREEFLLKRTGETRMEFVKDIAELMPGADAYFITKEVSANQVAHIHQPIFISSVTATLKELELPKNIHRFNGWNTFIKREEWEIATNDEHAVKNTFERLGWKYIIVKDEPGMIAARVISMIINEAYFALGDDISTKDEIDIAMKLGTNYPYGPFEWAEKIGLENIYDLLQKLAEDDDRYSISAAMQKEFKR